MCFNMEAADYLVVSFLRNEGILVWSGLQRHAYTVAPVCCAVVLPGGRPLTGQTLTDDDPEWIT